MVAALLVCLLSFAVVWDQHGIGPSAETRKFRKLMAGTTRVKVSRHMDVWDSSKERSYPDVQQWSFSLHSEDAGEFVHSILIESRLKMVLRFHKMVQFDIEEWTRCEFYAGEKLIDTVIITDLGGAGIIYMPKVMANGRNNGRHLNPYSYRKIEQIFREQPKDSKVNRP